MCQNNNSENQRKQPMPPKPKTSERGYSLPPTSAKPPMPNVKPPKK